MNFLFTYPSIAYRCLILSQVLDMLTTLFINEGQTMILQRPLSPLLTVALVLLTALGTTHSKAETLTYRFAAVVDSSTSPAAFISSFGAQSGDLISLEFDISTQERGVRIPSPRGKHKVYMHTLTRLRVSFGTFLFDSLEGQLRGSVSVKNNYTETSDQSPTDTLSFVAQATTPNGHSITAQAILVDSSAHAIYNTGLNHDASFFPDISLSLISTSEAHYGAVVSELGEAEARPEAFSQCLFSCEHRAQHICKKRKKKRRKRRCIQNRQQKCELRRCSD